MPSSARLAGASVFACALTFAAVAEAQVARLSTSNDTILPDRHTVFVESANLPGRGILVVRALRNGDIDPAPRGQLVVRAGQSSGLRVKLTRPALPGEELTVMLHADYGKAGIYDAADPVVLSVDIPASVVSRAAGRS